MISLTTKLPLEDSLTSKKNMQIKQEQLPKEIQQKLKLIEKAFR